MQMKKALASLLIAAGTIGALATPLTSVAAVDIQLNFGPQPVQYERLPPPRRGYVWAPGYWVWQGDGNVWVSGRWIRERHGYAIQPAYSRSRPWDRDGDGVPNRFDRRPDNPYRR